MKHFIASACMALLMGGAVLVVQPVMSEATSLPTRNAVYYPNPNPEFAVTSDTQPEPERHYHKKWTKKHHKHHHKLHAKQHQRHWWS